MANNKKSKSIGAGSAQKALTRNQALIPFDWDKNNQIPEILEEIKNIFAPGGVEKIIIEVGRPFLVTYNEEEDADEDRPRVDIGTILGAIDMVPVIVPEGASPAEVISAAISDVDEDKLVAAFIVTKSREILSLWYTAGASDKKDRIMNMTIHESPTLPEDVAIVCGAVTKLAIPTDIAKGYRINLEMPEEEEDSGSDV